MVSAFELKAALTERYAPELIIVNGVGKHSWLPALSQRQLRVHFDSIPEIEALAKKAAHQAWRVGIRCLLNAERDPDEPTYPTQFGLTPDEAVHAAQLLRFNSVHIEGLHFHLRSNIPDPAYYQESIEQLATLCERAKLAPYYVDCGGGLPVASVTDRSGASFRRFSLRRLWGVFRRVPRLMPSVREIWMENGRFISSDAGVLVLSIIDVKYRDGMRFLICDGGRTNHAMVSDWERHDIITVPERRGQRCASTICGPTCMAYDRLDRVMLPADIVPGDRLLWMSAGAYHIPWETRFSHGLAPVVWVDGGKIITIARARETFAHWWSMWE